MIMINFIRGFFMALADSVPGVSGGTIAFILGFYDDFINSINSLISKTTKKIERKKAALFLGKLGFGWIFGMGISVLILSSIFDKEIYKISSLFVGFILFSIPLIINEEKATLKNKYQYIIFTLLGIVIVSAITYLNPVSNSIDEVQSINYLYIFIAGMIAISAMVLPGISGSTILLILGLYAPIITAIRSLMSFEFNRVPMLLTFGIGILVGIFSIIRLLRYLLTNYRPQMIYFILGLMLASLYAVFMGPTTLDNPKEPMTIHSFSIIFFLIGGLLIFGLDELKKYLNK
ncbi:DUF368 domain-containing protein [Mycoplasmatota bacterium]|nr:DUF368 domain-containing protein [Mycoplasmatota bacterium]